MISYMSAGPGLEHGLKPPEVPDPHTLPSVDELLHGYEHVVPEIVNALRPIEVRYANDPTWVMRDKGERLTYNRVWLRAGGDMPDDPMLHTAAMVYSSDAAPLDSVITTHGLSWGYDHVFAASVNHSIWFHVPHDPREVSRILTEGRVDECLRNEVFRKTYIGAV